MKTLNKVENRLIKDIESGAYRDYYLIYNRKSTDEKDSQKNSLKHQKLENVKFARKEGVPLAQLSLKSFCVEGVISESHSGFEEDDNVVITDNGSVQYKIARPKFLKLIQFLNKGFFKGMVCLCWDRISRNKADDTIIRKLIRNGVDIRFVWANYDKSSSGELHMDIDGMFSEHHSRVTSEKVTAATKKLRDDGICTYRAPIGYLNLGKKIHNKPLDPERAPILKEIFELAATGDWTLSELTGWAKEQGLTMPPMRRKRTEEEMLAEEDEVQIEKVSRPVSLTNLHRVLTNPFYTSKIIGNKGEYIESSSHEALVDEETFNKVQMALNKRRTSVHYVDKLDLPDRGIVRCQECTRVYTPYIRKGILYFNARCVPGCKNEKKNFNINFLEGEVGKLISNLSFTDDELAEIDARIDTDVAIFDQKRQKALEQNERRKKKIREDLSYLNSNRLNLLKSGVYSPESFLEEEHKLNTELILLQNEEQVSDISMHEVIKDVVNLSELLKDASAYWSSANSREREEIIRIIFSELYVSGNSFKYQCKNGFKALESRFTSSCDPTRSRTALLALKRRCPNR